MSQVPPTDSPNPNIAALMADLEDSIKNFDDRLKECSTSDGEVAAPVFRQDAPNFPSLDPEAVRILQSLPSVPKKRVDVEAADNAPTGLLDALAREAGQHTAAMEEAQALDQESRQIIDTALRKIFDYLHQLTQHLNVLRPALSGTYSLSRDLVFENVQWQDGAADFRTESLSERAYYTSVVLRGRCQAARPLRINCPNEKADVFRGELSLLNLKIDDEQEEERSTLFVLSPQLPVQLHFAAELSARAVVLRARNFAGLGLNAFSINPSEVDTRLLDELGLFLLGRSRRLPKALKNIPFRPVGAR